MAVWDRAQRIAVIVGTRPEAIKLAPVIKALRDKPAENAVGIVPQPDVVVVSTGQQRELAHAALADFGIAPDLALDPELLRDSMAARTSQLVTRLCQALGGLGPDHVDLVVVQGDTLSALAGAMAARFLEIPSAHLEAGLRSGSEADPWPEESNRRAIATMASLHFAPTSAARENLLDEGVSPSSIYVTGNTGVDALFSVLGGPTSHNGEGDSEPGLILATAHRRNGYEQFHKAMCDGLNDLSADGWPVLFVAHSNPRAVEPIRARLDPGIDVIQPQSFHRFVSLMGQAACIVTDSGGVQEEATVLGIPSVIIRSLTERPESLVRQACLVRPEGEAIAAAVARAAHGPRLSEDARSAFGDGRAAERIRSILASFLTMGSALPSAQVMPPLLNELFE